MTCDISFQWRAFGEKNDEMESIAEEVCRGKMEVALERVAKRYPQSKRFIVYVHDDAHISLRAYDCEECTHYMISASLTFMPIEPLAEMLDQAMMHAAHEDEEDPGIMPAECLEWIHNRLWCFVPKGDLVFGGIGRMEPKLREALKALKDRGLLDGMPGQGVTYVRYRKDADVIKRRVWIPQCLNDLEVGDTATVPQIMKELYKRCFIDHIVDHAVYCDGLDAPVKALETEMMEYATAVADGE